MQYWIDLMTQGWFKGPSFIFEILPTWKKSRIEQIMKRKILYPRKSWTNWKPPYFQFHQPIFDSTRNQQNLNTWSKKTSLLPSKRTSPPVQKFLGTPSFGNEKVTNPLQKLDPEYLLEERTSFVSLTDFLSFLPYLQWSSLQNQVQVSFFGFHFFFFFIRERVKVHKIIGKTSLLANWGKRIAKNLGQSENCLIVQHFLGSSSHSANHLHIIQRLMGEMKLAFNLNKEIPVHPDQILGEMNEWINLAAISPNRKIIWILDGLSELEEIGNARNLDWLPESFPPNFHLFISVVENDPIHEKTKLKGWSLHNLRLEPLQRAELLEIASSFLGRYNKSLSQGQLFSLLGNPCSTNALFLVTFLNEIRLLGSFNTFYEQFSYYASAQNIPELFQKVLERLEKDYDEKRLGIVRKATSALWILRQGMAEKELIEFLGVNRRTFSPFFIAIEHLLVNHSGSFLPLHQ